MSYVEKLYKIKKQPTRELQFFWKTQVTYWMKYIQQLLISRMFWCICSWHRYHSVCLEIYLWLYERSLSDFSHLPTVSKKRTTFQTELDRITAILDHRNELILNEIRVTINSKQDEVEISNWEVELFLMEQ